MVVVGRYTAHMPTVEKHAPGSFNWIELGTPDQNGAKAFYGSLLGWSFEDHSMGPMGVYTMFKLDGRDTGGCYQLGPQSQGVPPHWSLFVASDNADETAARARQLGGTVMHGPFDVSDLGRMAVLRDPTGAVLGIWQPGKNTGLGIGGVNTLCWADLSTPDRQRAKAFYEGIFGWRITPGKDKSADDYLHLQNGHQYIGGILPDDLRSKNTGAHWIVYFQVADCAASAAKARELGAAVLMGPMTMEAGSYAVIQDPQGAHFSLFQPVLR